MEDTNFIARFEELFGLPFISVVNYENLCEELDDDGIYHYVDLLSKDVYSYDTLEDVWLEKNVYRDDILQRILTKN